MIRVGSVVVNEAYAAGVQMPFGGYGQPGYGRAKGREALWNWMRGRNMAIKLAP